MSPPNKKAPPKKRNLAARALRDPLFRPKIMAKPNAYKRHQRFAKKPVNLSENDEMN